LHRPPEHEAFGVTRVRLVEHMLASGDDVGGATVVPVDWMQQREAGMVVLVVVPGDEFPHDLARVLERAECSGMSGRYLSVRKFDSEYGLSLDVYGRLWLFAMPRST